MRLLVLKTILVATDLDESSLPAIVAGRALAAAADAELHVVTVSASSPPDASGVHKLLERAGVGLTEASVHAVAGDPTLAIGRLADAISADVIVLGPHHHAGDAAVAGTMLGIVTNSAAPCLVANSLHLPIARVVVAVDLSETSRGALIVALSWASALRANRVRLQLGVKLTALHVTKRDASIDELHGLERSLARQVDALRDEAGSWANVSVASDVISGDRVDEAVTGYAAEHGAELIVLGTRGLGLDTVGRVGSVAASVAAKTIIPTLLVPPAIWLELGRVRPRRRLRMGAIPRAG